MGHERASDDQTGDAPAEQDRAAMRRDGCFLLDETGRRFLDLGLPVDGQPGLTDISDADKTRLSAHGERLGKAFAEECASNDIRGVWTGTAPTFEIGFAGQENASPELMATAFEGELRKADVWGGASLHLPHQMGDAEAGLAESALRHCVARLRTLLVEHNSYISGGLRFPFPPSAPGMAERGLAIYRFPKTGNVEVTAVDDRVRIEFAPGDLGPTTSSGFYIPTLVEGDFEFAARYEIDGWRPDAVEPACFALFVQNEASTFRYYAQRMSAGTEAHRLVASTVTSTEQLLGDPVPVTAQKGEFRLTRRGREITFEHREGWGENEPWSTLGKAPAPPEDEVILGAKIWAKLRCQGLSVEICNLEVQGRIATRQVPPVPVVEDPRGGSPPR